MSNRANIASNMANILFNRANTASNRATIASNRANIESNRANIAPNRAHFKFSASERGCSLERGKKGVGVIRIITVVVVYIMI